jgi:pimeloyl-ACP methyl ester carboxylesterase
LDNEKAWNEFYKNNCNSKALSLSSSPVSFPDLVQTIQRMGLMGKHKSVHAELDDIRKWHVDRGFKGGLVLRDLQQPLFADASDENSSSSSSSSSHGQSQSQSAQKDMTENTNTNDMERNLERRECYYLYYEIKGTGEIQQQLFCRGTTLAVDIWTCLQSWMVHDEDLDCFVHRGFRNHADRILHDVLPLLAPPTDRRATIHVCGHSLGGAVASILCIKLQKRGYRVIRLTTVGEPRTCASTQHAERLERQLPRNAIRVEHELDFVTFLPPFGSKHRAGPKIWLLRDGTMRLVPPRRHSPGSTATSSSSIFSFSMFDDPLWWTDSVLVNFLAWEVLSSKGRQHRIPTYVEQLSKLLPP